MSMAVEIFESAPAPEVNYKALSSAAVLSVILGLLSAAALLDWILLGIPLVGILTGFYACRNVRQRSEELTGSGLARAGLALSVLFLFTGAGRLSYIYATEVPENHQRISYAELQPDPDEPDQLMPREALALDGKKVFIKGYPLAGRQMEDIRHFVLVRDKGDCCFGGNPKLTDQIEVVLADPLRLSYEPRLLKLAGTFRIHLPPEGLAPSRPIYYLEATHLQ